MTSTAGPRALARARSAFLGAEPFDPGAVRAPILASWTRSRDRAVPLVAGHIPYQRDLDDDTPLVRAAGRVLTTLEDVLAAEPVSMVLCDSVGTVLRRWTGDDRLERHLDRVSLARGFSYAERHVGTNGIGTALESGVPARVVGHEHFAENLEHLACAAAPVRHPVSGEVAGVVNLTCRARDAGVLLLTTITSIAGQIRQALLEDLGRHERALLAELLAGLQDGTRPQVLPAMRLTGADLPRQRPAGRSTSPAFAACSRAVARHAATSTWLVLQGEPGTGKTALAAASGRPVRVLDAADAGPAWLDRVAGACDADDCGLVLQHVDRLDDAVQRDLAALLGALGATRPWVVATVGPLPSVLPPGTVALLSCFPTPVPVPALRHRSGDLPWLVHELLGDASREARWSPAALDVLARLPWPGNLVDLRRVLVEAVPARGRQPVDVADLPAHLVATARRRLTPLEAMEREALMLAMAQARGSKEQAAQALGASRATVYRKVRRYGLSPLAD